MKNIGYYNGKTGLIEEMTIPMNDRACYFGDGIYDFAYGKNRVVFLADEHIERFFSNCDKIGIKLTFTRAELRSLLFELLGKVDADECYVYFQTSRGTAPRNHLFPKNVAPNLYITVRPAPEPLNLEKKVKLITLEDTRFLHCDLKTLNLLPSVLASQRAADAGCGECVFHRGEVVTECAHSNVSILKDGVFRTHPADCYILPGIARAHLIKACRKLHIPVDESAFTLRELRGADEIVVSSTTKFCLFAEELDGERVGGHAPELVKLLQSEVMAEFQRATGAA